MSDLTVHVKFTAAELLKLDAEVRRQQALAPAGDVSRPSVLRQLVRQLPDVAPAAAKRKKDLQAWAEDRRSPHPSPPPPPPDDAGDIVKSTPPDPHKGAGDIVAPAAAKRAPAKGKGEPSSDAIDPNPPPPPPDDRRRR